MFAFSKKKAPQSSFKEIFFVSKKHGGIAKRKCRVIHGPLCFFPLLLPCFPKNSFP